MQDKDRQVKSKFSILSAVKYLFAALMFGAMVLMVIVTYTAVR